MGAVVEALERVPGDRLVPVDLAAGRAQLGKIPVGRRQAADAIDDESHRDACARALDEGTENLIGDAAAEEKVGLEVHAALCAAERAELRRAARGAGGGPPPVAHRAR